MNMVLKMHKYVILHTFQRTGRNFVISAIHQLSDVWIDSSQTLDLAKYEDYDRIITIIRNPVECIASLATMAAKYHPESSVQDNVRSASNSWLHFHTELGTFNNVCLDFKELENDVYSFIKLVMHISKVKQIKNFSDIDMDKVMKTYEETEKHGFTITEKNNPAYLEVLYCVKSLDLTKHMDIYKELVARCVH